MPVTLLIVGAGSRGAMFADYALRHPDEAAVTAVAEPRGAHRERLAELHGVAPERRIEDWRDAAAHSRLGGRRRRRDPGSGPHRASRSPHSAAWRTSAPTSARAARASAAYGATWRPVARSPRAGAIPGMLERGVTGWPLDVLAWPSTQESITAALREGPCMRDRETRIFGTRGELHGDGNRVDVYDFLSGTTTRHESGVYSDGGAVAGPARPRRRPTVQT